MIYLYLIGLEFIYKLYDDQYGLDIGAFHQRGYPPSRCALFHGKSENKMDDDWGYPHLWKPPHELISTTIN